MSTDYIDYLIKNFKLPPKEGFYPKKPTEAMSLHKLMVNGKIPKNAEFIKMYAMPSDPSKGYNYALPSDCREMTREEVDFYMSVLEKTHPRKAPVFGAKEAPVKKLPEMYPVFDEIKGKKIICFDTETTGIGGSDEILQLSIVAFGRDGKVTPIYDEYFKPENHTSWDAAERVNGISPDKVKNCPYFSDVIGKLAPIFDAADIIVGYNVAFDTRMVEQSSKGEFVIPKEKLCDPIVYFREHEKDKKHKLIDACLEYCPDKIGWFECHAHDSSADAIITLEVLKSMGLKEGVDISTSFEEELETNKEPEI